MTEKQDNLVWHRVADVDVIPDGRVTTVTAGVKAICLAHFEGQYYALDNHCPHQGGPLGEGQIEDGCVICPWHGYEYSPIDGSPPEGYGDYATSYPLEVRDDGIYVAVEPVKHEYTISHQMMEVAVEWGLTHVFGMVGHSNLGLAEAFRTQERKGNLTYIGIRHEGAAAFAAGAYAKLTGNPAACFGIAGPGSTNLLTGCWDAHVDRAPLLALCGQVNTQVLGPGAFQEIDLAAAFDAVSLWGQTVLNAQNASELMALALKHAIVEQGPTHLIFPDEVQQKPGMKELPQTPKRGRVSTTAITPPREQIDEAIALLKDAKIVSIIAGHGARFHRDKVIQLGETLNAPMITTFKAKGVVPDTHPLACGVLGRSGTPVASRMMGRADVLVVLGASFSNHTGISTNKKLIQVDYDRMTLGKFHAVDVPLWGDIGTTVDILCEALGGETWARDFIADEIAGRWDRWRKEKDLRAQEDDANGVNAAIIFKHLSDLAPENAVFAVDVGNNTYSFGRYFETKPGQEVVMSGYLGSIGYAFPAAMGAWAARPGQPIFAVAGDGGFGQYAMEFTTAVKYDMPIKLVLLNNGQLAKISKEQRDIELEVWQTSLVNPNFADFAQSCGGWGKQIRRNDAVRDGLQELIAQPGPGILEIIQDPLKL
ncbi:MAG: thiamine pyrophosphate-binding protein [Chloroflexi bacterium]|nr:MAG: thiamine pyrophosphate-binding protein [Chloroflexota bacterium]